MVGKFFYLRNSFHLSARKLNESRVGLQVALRPIHAAKATKKSLKNILLLEGLNLNTKPLCNLFLVLKLFKLQLTVLTIKLNEIL